MAEATRTASPAWTSPKVARLLCVVDCYDAMSSERPYRSALSYRQCLAELRRLAGSQFDSDMVAAFLKALGACGGGVPRWTSSPSGPRP